MAPKTQSEKPAVEEMVKKNLKVDPSKLGDTHLAPPKDRSPSDVTSCISSSGDATCSFKDTDLDQESMLSEQSFYYPPNSYYGYYYPGYDASTGELDDQGYYFSNDGLEIQYPAMQADNGSLIYYTPGYQPGYGPYSPYVPSATMGADGQYMGQQSYYVSPMSPQPITSSAYYPTSPYGSEVMSSYIWDPSLQAGDVIYGNGYGGVPSFPGYSPSFSVPGNTFAPSKSLPGSKPNNLEMKGSFPAVDDVSTANDIKPVNKANTVLSKGYFPMSKLPGSNQGKGGLLYPNSSLNFKANVRGWGGGTEKLKTRGKSNGTNELDLLNEQNRGPRTNSTKGASEYGVDTAGSPLTKGNDSNDSSATIIKRDQYNDPSFSSKYEHALFFVIKSYSEDDIHKSIKYNVWASTPNGNKRLDSAYQEAQDKMAEKGTKCPVFLFFSVNASGQFCGVAEMIGRVDFNKNMDFWQQDKWNGFFPVKWHFIKDVPNPHFRHILLENNDNKPVTNSRDTQEVRFPQGTEILNIFKNYILKTSILDDFAFYESRQKAMQDKRVRAPMRLGQLQKLDEVGQVASELQAIDLGAKKQHTELVMGEAAKA